LLIVNLKSLIHNLQPVIFKNLSLLTLLSILLVLPAARSRAAWLGALVGVAFLACHKYHLNSLLRSLITGRIKSPLGDLGVNTRKIVIVLLPALVLLASSLGLYHYKKDSADGRMLIWTVTANMIKDYPLLGVGQDMLKAHYMDYQADYFRNHPNSKYEMVADDNQYVFNEILNTWAENGLIGFLLFIGIVAVVFLSPINHKEHEVHKEVINYLNHEGHKEREGKNEVAQPAPDGYRDINLTHATITKASILAILVFSMFAYPSEILPIKIVATVCIALLAGKAVPLFKGEEIPFVKKTWCSLCPLWLTLPLTATVVALVWLAPLVKNLQGAYKTWNDAFELYNYGLYTECLEDYQKALPLLQHNGEFMINYGKALSIVEKHKEAIEILGQAKNYQNNTVLGTAFGDSQKALKQNADAEKNYWMASEMAPGKFYAQYLLAKLYDETGQHQKAVDIATSILIKEIKIESTAIDEIHNEMEKLMRETPKAIPF